MGPTEHKIKQYKKIFRRLESCLEVSHSGHHQLSTKP